MYWENWTGTCKRMKLCHYLTPYAKINTKWIKNLYVTPETVKFPKENKGHQLLDFCLGDDLWI